MSDSEKWSRKNVFEIPPCAKPYFWTKTDDEKWSRKNVFEIPPCAKPFSDLLIYFNKVRIFCLKL